MLSSPQKLPYAIWMIARKLQHYFMEHPVIVVSEAPLKSILTNPDATGRVSQWAIELGPKGITYVNRTTIKSQGVFYEVINKPSIKYKPPANPVVDSRVMQEGPKAADTS